ncbi:MAG: tetratricopeptide repeat protein, partial [Bacteroidota bacterium]|nr:tetratricopeptide repeat protein [Bacteroidota bacterium]
MSCPLFAQNESNQVQKLLDSVNENRTDTAQAFRLLKEAFDLAEKSKDPILIGDCHQIKGILFYAHGIHTSSRVEWEMARDIYQNEGDTVKWAKTERLLGIHYDATGVWEKSLEFFLKSRSLYAAVGNKKGLGEVLLSIAIIQQRLGKANEAMENHREALQIAIDQGNTAVVGPIYNNMGSLFKDLNQFDSSEKYLLLAVELQKQANNLHGLGQTLHNLGSLERARGNFEKALSYYKQSAGLKIGVDVTYFLTVGDCFNQLGQLDSARYYLYQALEISQEGGLVQRISESYQFLCETEEKAGNYKKALEYHKLYFTYQDTVNEEYFKESLHKMEAEIALGLEKEKNEALREIQKQNEALIQKNEQFIWLLTGLLIALLTLAFVLIRNIQKLKTSRQSLHQLNEELVESAAHLQHNNEYLEKLMQDKNDLVSVLAHDLRSPFSKIQSITDLFDLSDKK